jgi:O-antigen ligase
MKERVIRIAGIINEYAVYGFLLFLPCAPAALEILFYLSLTAFLVKKILNREFDYLKETPSFFLLLFLFFCAVSLFNSGIFIKKSLLALFFKWGQYVLVYFLVRDAISDRKKANNCIRILFFVSFILCLDAFSQRYLGYEFIRHRSLIDIGGAYAVTASFHHFNDFGAYLIFPLSLILAVLISPKIKHSKTFFIYFGLGAFLIISSFLTLSRGSWLGLTISAIFILLLARKYRISVILALSILLIVNLIPQIRDRIMFSFQKGGDSGRFLFWKTAWLMIKDNPFLGKGIGTFMDYFPRYAPEAGGALYAHNCYLQIWAETGIFSLLSFLVFCYLFLFNAVKTFLKKNDFWLLGLIAGILGFLVHSFFDTQLYSLQLSFLFWTMVGLLAAFNKILLKDKIK